MQTRKVLTILFYVATILISVSLGKQFSSDKRVQGSHSSFQTMMRYGRANPPDKDKVKIYPRADTFFLGPRYGKRSSWSPNASLVFPLSTPLCGMDEELTCTYTGISDLYRCTPRTEGGGYGEDVAKYSTTLN